MKDFKIFLSVNPGHSTYYYNLGYRDYVQFRTSEIENFGIIMKSDILRKEIYRMFKIKIREELKICDNCNYIIQNIYSNVYSKCLEVTVVNDLKNEIDFKVNELFKEIKNKYKTPVILKIFNRDIADIIISKINEIPYILDIERLSVHNRIIIKKLKKKLKVLNLSIEINSDNYYYGEIKHLIIY